MTEAEFSTWSLRICLTGLMLYMLFIVYDLAKQSNAGKWGYIALFGALGLGMLGFVIKLVIVKMMGM